MAKPSEKVYHFINEHHVLSLATVNAQGECSSCSLFYAFDEEALTFIFASDKKTEHIQNILSHNSVSAAIHFETKEVGTIRGLQVKAEVYEGSATDKSVYLECFPYARVMPKLRVWKMKILSLKYTDNRLGFGKKEIWQSS